MDTLSCVLFCIALYGSPGPATLSLASSGMALGFRGSLPYVAGIVIGIIITIAVTFSGLFALLKSSEVAALALRYIGFAFILYLGWKIIRSRPGTSVTTDTPFKLQNGVLLNTLNPKAYLAAALVYSQFGSRQTLFSLLTLILVTTILLDLGWCLLGSTIKRFQPSCVAMIRLNWAFGVLLVLVAFSSLLL